MTSLETETTPPRIPLWAPFAALFAVLLFTTTFSAAVVGVVMLADPSIEADELPNALLLGLMLLQNAAFIFGAWITVRLALGRTVREQLGLVRVTQRGRAILWAAAVYAGFWAVTIALTQIFGPPGDQDLVSDIKQEDSVAVLLIAGFVICIVAPVAEELFFRGLMFTVLARALPAGWAALIVGGLFGLGHAPGAPLIAVIALGVFGVGLCLLYWLTKSIIPGMALHALNNAITFGAIKDLDPALFAGVVALSVGVVTAGAAAVSTRTRTAVTA